MRRFAAVVLMLGSMVRVEAVPEAFEVGPERLGELPRGKEADGIAGDFVLRNDRIEAVIAGNLAERRANMSTFYGADGVTPGCLYDLCLRGSGNDQMTVFSPAGQRGKVSWVRVVRDGRDGEAEIECVTTAAGNKGIYRRHLWRLRDGMEAVEVETTIRNESGAMVRMQVDDKLVPLGKAGDGPGVVWADAVDPADKSGYAVEAVRGNLELKPGEEKRYVRHVAVGSSPAAAVGVLLKAGGGAGSLSLTLREGSGPAGSGAVVMIGSGGREVPAYPDANGALRVAVSAGACRISVREAGRAPVRVSVDVVSGAETVREVILPPQSLVQFAITEGGSGRSLPCKVQFAAMSGTAAVDLGPANRAHGCVDQWHSETGTFTVPLNPGSYRVTVTRGPEYSHLVREVVVAEGGRAEVRGELVREVDTKGWLSTDFHNHSTPSGDNTCGTDDRLINLAAEHIEFAPTTEHNRLFDWGPRIAALKLGQWLSTVPGVELTGPTEHVNCFPLTPVPGIQNNGAPPWNADPRITAITLRDWPGGGADRWIQVNHPNLQKVFADRDADGVVEGGYDGIVPMVDAWEVENFIDQGLLATAPFRVEGAPGKPRKVLYNRGFIWLQLLNQGHRMRAVAVADAHSVHGNGVGGWRTWLPSASDDPEKADWRALSRAAKAGHSVLSTGPFMEVSCNGAPPGSEIHAPGGKVVIKVRVQCAGWLDVDRVQIFVNGRQPRELDFTRASHPDWFGSGTVRFEREIPVTLEADAHLIVMAAGMQGDLRAAFGSSAQSVLKPMAWHNPVYVDCDGNGWKASGDTLGYEIPHGRLTVDEALRLLSVTQ